MHVRGYMCTAQGPRLSCLHHSSLDYLPTYLTCTRPALRRAARSGTDSLYVSTHLLLKNQTTVRTRSFDGPSPTQLNWTELNSL
jgi:hypothetical protein